MPCKTVGEEVSKGAIARKVSKKRPDDVTIGSGNVADLAFELRKEGSGFPIPQEIATQGD